MISTYIKEYKGYSIMFQYDRGVVWSALKGGLTVASSTAKFPSEDGAFEDAKGYLDLVSKLEEQE